jgi:hypothetical protein
MTFDELRNRHNGQPYSILIGIDAGVHTGVASYSPATGRLEKVQTLKIHEAMDYVKKQFAVNGQSLKVYCEDARQRVWFGNSGREKLQGAGSVKRDSGIWEDFLTSLNIPFEMIPPRYNRTKLDSISFKKITGYMEKTNEHGRDAAMLVYGKN